MDVQAILRNLINTITHAPVFNEFELKTSIVGIDINETYMHGHSQLKISFFRYHSKFFTTQFIDRNNHKVLFYFRQCPYFISIP